MSKSKQSSTKKEDAEKKLAHAVFESLRKGKSKQELVTELVKGGWEKQKAKQYLNDARQHFPEWKENMTRHCGTKIIRGFAIAAVAGTISVMSYLDASKGGGSYVIAYGAVIFGIFDFLGGCIGWLRYRKDVRLKE